MIALGEFAGGYRAADSCDECTKLDDAVAPGEALLRQKLRQQSIFRRAEERAFCADQKYARAFHGQVVPRERRDKKCHDAELEKLCADGDAAFAVAVREVAAGHREEDERNREERSDNGDQAVSLHLREIHCDDDVGDEELQPVVVKPGLELGDDEAPETAAPGEGRLWLGSGRVCWAFGHDRLCSWPRQRLIPFCGTRELLRLEVSVDRVFSAS